MVNYSTAFFGLIHCYCSTFSANSSWAVEILHAEVAVSCEYRPVTVRLAVRPLCSLQLRCCPLLALTELLSVVLPACGRSSLLRLLRIWLLQGPVTLAPGPATIPHTGTLDPVPPDQRPLCCSQRFARLLRSLVQPL